MPGGIPSGLRPCPAAPPAALSMPNVTRRTTSELARHHAPRARAGPRAARVGRPPPARARPHPRLRPLRLLPADVPELRGLRGGDGLPPGPDPADAGGARGGLGDLARDG